MMPTYLSKKDNVLEVRFVDEDISVSRYTTPRASEG